MRQFGYLCFSLCQCAFLNNKSNSHKNIGTIHVSHYSVIYEEVIVERKLVHRQCALGYPTTMFQAAPVSNGYKRQVLHSENVHTNA